MKKRYPITPPVNMREIYTKGCDKWLKYYKQAGIQLKAHPNAIQHNNDMKNMRWYQHDYFWINWKSISTSFVNAPAT